MDQFLYQRPREKLHEKGANFLTMVELIQTILGSGSAKTSVAKLARQLEKLFLRGALTYNDLIAVGGIGHAKACQLLAAIELGRRLHWSQHDISTQHNPSSHLLISKARQNKKATMICNWYNGAQELIECKVYKSKRTEHYGVTIKQAFADGLSMSARSVAVAIPSVHIDAPTVRILGILQALKGAASLLEVRLNSIYGVSATGHADWGHEL